MRGFDSGCVVLAIDTATATTVAGVARAGEVLASFAHTDPLRHGEVLMPGIATMLEDAQVARSDLAGIVVGVGPGPYTGLRVGIATAVGLGAALGITVEGVCSLDAVSLGIPDEAFASGEVLVASDARRREVYWAAFTAPGLRVGAPSVAKPADIATDRRVAGAGPRLYPDAFPTSLAAEAPDGGLLAAAASTGRLERRDLRPLYIRRPDAVAPTARKSALTSGERR